ncbi:MAG TPA: 4Fe-4S dicluster domain-containing protein [Thermodesulfobacteriota bacterium]|nr:4Fe-4S dicluster domain-containing protein [Thermodesulfobacteriota bacterium]
MIQKRIREEAKKLLENKEVDVIVGFGEGTLPLRATPVFIRSPEEADRLIWNSFCENNLTTYLHKLERFKVGLVAKGCDTRSVVALSHEKRFRNNPVYLIGVPCQGMVDRRRVKKAVKGEILKATEEGDRIIVSGDGFQVTLKKDEFLYPSCQVCAHRNPVQANVMVADPVEEKALLENHPDLEAFEKGTPGERWKFFEKEASRCIRCYACRETCPMCYCKECFVDNSRPKWVEKGLHSKDLQFYHIVRAYHQAGRCSACGACERACSMEIKLNYMTQRLNQDVKDLYGFETGVDKDAPPPLSTFETEDKQEFIK